MSAVAGMAVDRRKMSATAIGWVSSVFVAASAAARAASTVICTVATSSFSAPASERFGATSRNQNATPYTSSAPIRTP